MLSDLVNALTDTQIPFAHFAWSVAPSGTYGTYGEDGENRLAGDNKTAERVMVVYVNLFTKDDSSTPRATIESALDGIPCAWYLNTVQFEDDTGYIHYEWACEV